MGELLDIINEQDEVIGQAERDEVHKKGLLFRMTYVVFTTPEKRLILQRRSLTKKVNAGRLSMAVIGHVTSGDSYLETAIKESYEETGVIVDPAKLSRLDLSYSNYDEGDYLSNAIRALYAYEFDGNVSDLKIEEGEGTGFEMTTLEDLKVAINQNPDSYVPYLADIVTAGLLDPLASVKK